MLCRSNLSCLCLYPVALTSEDNLEKKQIHSFRAPAVSWNKQESTIIHIKHANIIWTENWITRKNKFIYENFTRAIINTDQDV